MRSVLSVMAVLPAIVIAPACNDKPLYTCEAVCSPGANGIEVKGNERDYSAETEADAVAQCTSAEDKDSAACPSGDTVTTCSCDAGN